MEMKTKSFPCCFPVVCLYSVFAPDRVYCASAIIDLHHVGQTNQWQHSHLV